MIVNDNFKELFGQIINEIKNSPEVLAQAATEISDEAKKQWDGLKEDVKQDWDKFKAAYEDMKNSKPVNIVLCDTELLKLQELVNFAKHNMVAGADSVAAFKMQKDDAYEVWLTYCKGSEMLPKEQNTYVCIRTEGLARDVKDTFDKENCIILK